MAISIKNAEGNMCSKDATNRSNIIPLEFSLDTTLSWIYCNYPEQITSSTGVFADTDLNNRYLNRATVKNSTQIFYSYQDQGQNETYYFGIQVYNPNSQSVTVSIKNKGHADNSYPPTGWRATAGEPWVQFFKGSNDKVTVPSGTSQWILNTRVNPGKAFSGNMRLKIEPENLNVSITVYMYKNINKVNRITAIPYERAKGMKNGQYSGIGKGYFFMSKKIILRASELLNKDKWFLTNTKKEDLNNITGSLNNIKVNGISGSDSIPLTLLNGDIISPNDVNNLANWCAQYYFPIQFINDTSITRTFKGYIRTAANRSDSWAVMSSGYDCKYSNTLNTNTLPTWNWTDVTVKRDDTYEDAYQAILGTNSVQLLKQIWSLS